MSSRKAVIVNDQAVSADLTTIEYVHVQINGMQYTAAKRCAAYTDGQGRNRDEYTLVPPAGTSEGAMRAALNKLHVQQMLQEYSDNMPLCICTPEDVDLLRQILRFKDTPISDDAGTRHYPTWEMVAAEMKRIGFVYRIPAGLTGESEDGRTLYFDSRTTLKVRFTTQAPVPAEA